MKPTLAVNNPANMSARNSKFSPNGIEILSALGQLAYLLNLCFGQFCPIVVLSPWCGSVPSPIKKIGSSSIPPKIINPIVSPYSIVMTGIHIFWSWANKCLKNKNMNWKVAKFHIFANGDCFISIATKCRQNWMRLQFENMPWPLSAKGSEIPHIAYLVSGKATYIFPNLIFHVKQLVRCLWQMLSGQFAASDYSFYYNATHANRPDKHDDITELVFCQGA